jgi:uncharacterized protein involved in type VI secretion and phage assembly
MTFLPLDRTSQPSQRANKLLGLHVGVVIDNEDDPPDNPGYRVKLRFDWLDASQQTFWARIAVPMAGSQRGTYVLPEKDDQVVVVFEHGDIDRPVVIGSMWSLRQKPVETNRSGNNNAKLIKSRSGHRMIFDDKDGAEKVTIVDRTKKNKIVLDSANRLVSIESDGDIEVKASENVILYAKSIEAGTSQRFSGSGQQLMVHAGAKLTMKASSHLTITSSSVQANTSSVPSTQGLQGRGTGELGAIAAETVKRRATE